MNATLLSSAFAADMMSRELALLDPGLGRSGLGAAAQARRRARHLFEHPRRPPRDCRSHYRRSRLAHRRFRSVSPFEHRVDQAINRDILVARKL